AQLPEARGPREGGLALLWGGGRGFRPPPRRARRMTTATALVVDDEPMVRHLVRRILEPEICSVVDVEDGETALRLLQRQADSIDLVLTDLSMPGIDGFD